MSYLIVALGLFFILIGYIVTENNAKYLLSGYNTMAEKDRRKIDISRYIPYFKKFHIGLGVSFMVLGVIITQFVGLEPAGVFIGLYPILAYVLFIWYGSKYLGAERLTNDWVANGLLVACLLFIGVMLIYESNKVN